MVALHLDAVRQVLPYEGPRRPEQHADQGEDRSVRNSVHGT
jgi:hypothetical protein